MKTMQQQIMRRVYYAYALSYTQQPLLYIGLVLGGAVALLGRFTHVAAIIDNTLAVPLGNLPSYIASIFMGAIARGELGTVLVVLTIASLTSAAVWQLSRVKFVPQYSLA